MDFIDTHAHVYEPEFDADRDEVMAAAGAAGVRRLLLPAIDGSSYDRMFDLCRRYPGRCFPMAGLHPTSVNDNPDWEAELLRVEQIVKSTQGPKICGIGEIGLDYYWSSDFRRQQRTAYIHQLELALEHGLPVAVHVREAWDDVLEIAREFRGRGLKGIFHAFSGTVECWRELREYGDFLFGIGGTVTYKKSAAAEAVREMELSEIVLETDCPYLTPAPHRGERNQPAYIPFICRRTAEIKGLDEAEVAAATTANAERMFLTS